MYRIQKRFTISCSHRLWDNSLSEQENKKIFGKCSNSPNHGHNYFVDVMLKDEKLEHGMIINFDEIKKVFKEKIDAIYDHHYLNDLIKELTTAENIAKIFYDVLKERFSMLYKIRVWETDGCFAEYFEEE